MRKKFYLPSCHSGLEEYDFVCDDIHDFYYLHSLKDKSDTHTIDIENTQSTNHILNALQQRKVFLGCLCSDNFIRDYFYKYYDMTPRHYIELSNIETVFLENLFSSLDEQSKKEVVPLLSLFTLEYQNFISLEQIEYSIHRQMETMINENSINIFKQFPFRNYEKQFLREIKEIYSSMYVAALTNEKFLNLKK